MRSRLLLAVPFALLFAAAPAVAQDASPAAGDASAAAGEYNIWYVNPLPTTPDWGRSWQAVP